MNALLTPQDADRSVLGAFDCVGHRLASFNTIVTTEVNSRQEEIAVEEEGR